MEDDMEHHHAEGLVFFTDLSRFMTVVQGMTADELADFMVAHAAIVDETISGGGGTLVKYINDSALGIFEGDDVDGAVRTLLTLKHRVETELSAPGRQVRVKIGAHYGPVVMPVLPPFPMRDLFGETVNITVSLGEGGTRTHRDRFILSATAFRKLGKETRKGFHKFTEPIVYLAEEGAR
jgi:adenylate cyclase